MILSLPTKIPFAGVLAIPALMFIAQMAVGTSLTFACGYFVYLLFAIMAFNLLEGARTIGGAVVLFITIRNVAAQVGKIALGQPAESNLASGDSTILVLAVGTAAVALAALAVRYLFPVRRGILAEETRLDRLRGLVQIFFALRMLTLLVERSALVRSFALGEVIGGIYSYLVFLPAACIAFGTAYHLTASEGRRSLGWSNVPHLLLAAVETLQFGYKQTLLLPVMTYLLTCVAYRKPYRKFELVAIAAAIMTVTPLLYVYSQIARNTVARDGQTPGGVIFDFLLHDTDTKIDDVLDVIQSRNAISREVGYYGAPMGVLDRIAVPVFNAAQVVRMAETRGDLGFDAIGAYFTFLPKSLTGQVTSFQIKGDVLGQFAGIIDSSNSKTGIEMDPVIASYAFGGWLGVTIFSFIGFAIFFAATNVTFGNIAQNPWATMALMSNFLVVTSGNVSFLFVFVLRWVPFLLLFVLAIGKLDRAR